ncbi:hypothetical protein ACVWVZ_000138 [Pseudomonas tolaasii]
METTDTTRMASGLLTQAFNDPPFYLQQVPIDGAESDAFSLREFTFLHQVIDMGTFEAGFPHHLVTAYDVKFHLWLSCFNNGEDWLDILATLGADWRVLRSDLN